MNTPGRVRVVVLDRGRGDGEAVVGLLRGSGRLDARAVDPVDLRARRLPWDDARTEDVAAVLLSVQAHPDTVPAVDRICRLLGEVPLVVVAPDTDDLHVQLLQAGACEVVAADGLHRAVLERAVRCAEARRSGVGAGATHASTDALTGLVNRAGLALDLGLRLGSCTRPGQVVVLFADLDRFKSVNDTYGHAVGDELLVEVADRLRRSVRSSDLVARIGGDEFVVVLDGPRVEEVAEEVCARVMAAFGSGLTVGGRHLSVGISLGLASSVPGESAAGLVDRADRALYLAKRRGRGQVARYDDDLERSVADLQAAADLLDDAVAGDGLRMLARPVVDRSSATVLGHLCQPVWAGDHPGRPGDGPGSVAVRVGRAADLLAWSAGQLARTLDPARTLAAPRRVFLEVPGPVVAHGAARLLSVVPPVGRERVVLVLGEDWLLQHPDPAALESLARAGFGLAVGGFGGSTAALSLLVRWEFDSVWLHESLVHRIAADRRRTAVLEGVVATATALGQRVVVEEPQRSLDADVVAGLGGVAVVVRRPGTPASRAGVPPSGVPVARG